MSVTENAAKSPARVDPDVSCETFQVDERVVRKYLERAKSTNENDAHHTLDYSPCEAAGDVVFDDGQTGHWTLNQARSGTLVITGREKLVLYCPDCELEPFQ